MDPGPHTPGDGSVKPLLAEGPLPPGSRVEELVDAIDRRIRSGGPDDVKEADEQADAVEDRPEEDHSAEGSDAAQDPTDDGAQVQEPPD